MIIIDRKTQHVPPRFTEREVPGTPYGLSKNDQDLFDGWYINYFLRHQLLLLLLDEDSGHIIALILLISL